MSDIAVRPQEWMEKISGLREHIGKVIVGQQDVVEQMLWCIFAGAMPSWKGFRVSAKRCSSAPCRRRWTCPFPAYSLRRI